MLNFNTFFFFIVVLNIFTKGANISVGGLSEKPPL